MRVEEYIEYHKWLRGITEDQIRRGYWMSELDKQTLKQQPEYFNRIVKGMIQNRDGMMRLAERNLIIIAAGDQNDPAGLLDIIEKTIDDEGVVEEVRAARAKLAEKNPFYEAEPRIAQWIKWLLGLAVLGGAILLAVMLLRRSGRATKST